MEHGEIVAEMPLPGWTRPCSPYAGSVKRQFRFGKFSSCLFLELKPVAWKDPSLFCAIRFVLAEKRLNQAGRRHAQSLILEIGELLRDHCLTPHDVGAVAVSRGPGSFTGLRVGMVCAKTFAYATSCRFIAVDTFAAIAENVPTDLTRVFVIEDAQRDDLFAAEFSREESQEAESHSQALIASASERPGLYQGSRRWKSISPLRIVPRIEFLRDRSEVDIVTGPGIKKFDPADIPSNWLSRMRRVICHVPSSSQDLVNVACCRTAIICHQETPISGRLSRFIFG